MNSGTGGSLVKVTQPQAYKVANYILKSPEFSQKEIVKKTGVSKGMVSYVIRWLTEKNYVKRTEKKYKLVSPTALISLFHLYRNMEKQLLGSFSVKPEPKALMKELIKRKVVFCTTTALQQYSPYFQDPSISFYSNDKRLLQELKTEIPGLTRINFYKPDMCLEIDIKKKGKMLLTSEARTIIDLFCNNQAYTAKELIERKYGGRLG